ncbi:MAG: hypothetical protein ABFR63_11245, partial [Thermodesulfobacteriota bacterium]
MVKKFIKTIAFTTAAFSCCALGTASAAVDLAPQMEGFQFIASKAGAAPGDVAAKRAAVMEICEHISEAAAYCPALSAVETLESGVEGVAYETALKFPYMDMNGDGVYDAASCNVELWNTMNDAMLIMDEDTRYMSALPWPVAVYTEGDDIKVAMRLPETTMRVFFNDSKNKEIYENMGGFIRANMEMFLEETLAHEDFDVNLVRVAESTVTEETLDMVQQMIGDIDSNKLAPTVSVSVSAVESVSGGVPALEAVTNALEIAVNTPRVPNFPAMADCSEDVDIPNPDCNGDGKVGGTAMLPDMFMAVMLGKMGVADMNAMMAGAPDMWNMGATFQQWKSVKLMQPESAPHIYQISVCQPFYAQPAVGASGDIYHQTIMPCRLIVWEKKGEIHIAI